MSRARGRRAAGRALLALGALAPALASAQAHPLVERDATHVRIRHAGSEALARRRVPLTCRALEELARLLEQPFPAHAAAVRVTRVAPRERAEYVLCLLADGTLVAGRQAHRLDPGGDAAGAPRGEIASAQPPLERPGPSMWLLTLPLTREATVLLEVRAEETGGRVDTLAIDARVLP